MEKKNSVLGVLVILLSIVVLGLTAFIVYDKVLNKDVKEEHTNISNDNKDINNNGTSNSINSYDYDAMLIAKEKMPTIVSLANQGDSNYKYCGDKDSSDAIEVDNRRFVVSTKFVSMSDIQEYLYKTITRDLFDKYFSAKGYAIQDGKLYCENGSAVDGFLGIFSTESRINNLENLKYTISNEKEDSFDAIMSFDYNSLVDEYNNGTYTFKSTFIKQNGNWLISTFE